MTDQPRFLPREVLFELLSAALEPWGSSSWYPSRPPTEESVRRIEAELKIKLPWRLIEVASACSSYGGWFGSIGDDFTSHNHMLSINRSFREEGMPSRYVLLNHGHDGHCDAWDVEAIASGQGEQPIVKFDYDIDRRELRPVQTCATSFAQYIDAFVRANAVRCPNQAIRRRAKRVLAVYGGS